MFTAFFVDPFCFSGEVFVFVFEIFCLLSLMLVLVLILLFGTFFELSRTSFIFSLGRIFSFIIFLALGFGIGIGITGSSFVVGVLPVFLTITGVSFLLTICLGIFKSKKINLIKK